MSDIKKERPTTTNLVDNSIMNCLKGIRANMFMDYMTESIQRLILSNGWRYGTGESDYYPSKDGNILLSDIVLLHFVEKMERDLILIRSEIVDPCLKLDFYYKFETFENRICNILENVDNAAEEIKTMTSMFKQIIELSGIVRNDLLNRLPQLID